MAEKSSAISKAMQSSHKKRKILLSRGILAAKVKPIIITINMKKRRKKKEIREIKADDDEEEEDFNNDGNIDFNEENLSINDGAMKEDIAKPPPIICEPLYFHDSDDDDDDDDEPAYENDEFQNVNENLLLLTKSVPLKENRDAEALYNDDENDNENCEDDFDYQYDLPGLIESILVKQNNYFVPQDAELPFYPGSKHTKVEFCEKFHSFIAANTLILKAQKELLNLLVEFFPAAELPFATSRAGNIVPNVENYVETAHRHVPIDCCLEGCMVFAGKYSELMKCAKCNRPRYTPCSMCSVTNDECSHISSRTSIKRFHFVPMTPKICELLKTKDFYNLLNYETVKYNEDFYCDTKDGSLYKSHLEQMHTRFPQVQQAFMHKNPILKGPEYEGYQYKEISLLLSQFLDGANIFTKSKESFNPYLFGILNLPPSYRY